MPKKRKNNTDIVIEYRLINIEILGITNNNKDGVDENQIGIGIKFYPQVDTNKSVVLLDIIIRLGIVGSIEELFVFNSRFTFLIKDISTLPSVDEGIDVPEFFLKNILNIAIGTSRGLMYTYTKNTNLNNFILPPINIEKLLESNMKFIEEMNNIKNNYEDSQKKNN